MQLREPLEYSVSSRQITPVAPPRAISARSFRTFANISMSRLATKCAIRKIRCVTSHFSFAPPKLNHMTSRTRHTFSIRKRRRQPVFAGLGILPGRVHIRDKRVRELVRAPRIVVNCSGDFPAAFVYPGVTHFVKFVRWRCFGLFYVSYYNRRVGV